ncbi:hypothetical protein WJX72_005793 [[Myrmecia] bisecta]|uniref:Uncharacterized protein n=1 Tax=[Myrmecia] bisecta TaxID=41462 RepID=A0AAW1P1N5_9CHLO
MHAYNYTDLRGKWMCGFCEEAPLTSYSELVTTPGTAFGSPAVAQLKQANCVGAVQDYTVWQSGYASSRSCNPEASTATSHPQVAF